jgi:hypothetical protein
MDVVIELVIASPAREVSETTCCKQGDGHPSKEEERHRKSRGGGGVHLRNHARRRRILRARALELALLEPSTGRVLEGTSDHFLGVCLVAEIVGDRVDRVLVAGEVVEPVNATVIEPVREDRLTTWCCSGGTARDDQSCDRARQESNQYRCRAVEGGRLRRHAFDGPVTVGRVSAFEAIGACAKRKHSVCWIDVATSFVC